MEHRLGCPGRNALGSSTRGLVPVAADDLELTVCGDGTSKDGDAASGYSGSAGDAMWLWAAVALGGVPGLAEADFGPDCVDGSDERPGWPGNRLERVMLRTSLDPAEPSAPFAPEATCNDGTPGTYFVRPGSGIDANRWLVLLEGGEGCYDAATCAARWCGTGVYDRDLMSSAAEPDTMPGFGALFPHPSNPFRDWTHVVVSYCSSDFWTGRQDIVASDPDDPGLSYRIGFHGADILDAVVEELSVGRAALDEAGLPALADAERVLLGGTSAGALGLMLQIDRVADRVALAAPEADVRAVFDSFFPPGGEVLGGAAYSGVFAAEAEALILDFATGSAGPDFWGTQAPEACLAHHPDDPHVCLEAQHVVMNHVRTPFFIHQDQWDPVVCRDDCSEGVRAQVEALASIAEDAPGREAPPVYPADTPPGWFVPRCGKHTALFSYGEGGRRFGRNILRRTPESRSIVSYALALSGWLEGDVVEAARQPGAPDCPSW